MKYVAWDGAKNEWLKVTRDISFEDVVDAIIDERMIGRFLHPNQVRHPGQYVFVARIGEYAYVVPFVEDEEKLFLKTIYPSRKYTKEYIEKGGL